MSANRIKLDQKKGSPQLYLVKLSGGSANGTRSICSGDVVYAAGERYERGADDLYYHVPQDKERAELIGRTL
jgi:hypothetical protein